MANVGALDKYDDEFKLKNDDVYISFLPLAHCFERFMMLSAIANRMEVGFY